MHLSHVWTTWVNILSRGLSLGDDLVVNPLLERSQGSPCRLPVLGVQRRVAGQLDHVLRVCGSCRDGFRWGRTWCGDHEHADCDDKRGGTDELGNAIRF